jgi:hypothetical protein
MTPSKRLSVDLPKSSSIHALVPPLAMAEALLGPAVASAGVLDAQEGDTSRSSPATQPDDVVVSLPGMALDESSPPPPPQPSTPAADSTDSPFASQAASDLTASLVSRAVAAAAALSAVSPLHPPPAVLAVRSVTPLSASVSAGEAAATNSAAAAVVEAAASTRDALVSPTSLHHWLQGLDLTQFLDAFIREEARFSRVVSHSCCLTRLSPRWICTRCPFCRSAISLRWASPSAGRGSRCWRRCGSSTCVRSARPLKAARRLARTPCP